MAPGRLRFAMVLFCELPIYQDVYKLILIEQDMKRDEIVLVRSICRKAEYRQAQSPRPRSSRASKL